MKILLLVPSLARKGPVIVACDIATGLVGKGHEVEVLYLDEISEIDFPCPVARFGWSSLKKIAEFDVIHSHSLRPDALAWFLRSILRVRVAYVSTIHNYVEKDLDFAYGKVVAAIFSRIWRFLWRGNDACVVLTKDALDYYRGSRLRAPLKVVYNGRPPHTVAPVDQSDQRMLDEVQRRFKIVGASAVVTERKGFDQIIRVLPSLPEYVFLLIGEGPALAGLVQLAVELGVSERFIRLGFRNNARDYLKFMDVYAMPSHSEGMPLAMLEAASGGVPIVCTDIPVFRELFAAGEVQFFELENGSSLVQAIERTKICADEMLAKARGRFDGNYSLQAMADGYAAVYHEVRCTV